MSAPLGLAPLLTALREAGLPVGVAEVARLQQVFALGPQLATPEDRRLKAILRAVLVKSVEDRARFEPVFDAWLDRAGGEIHLREAPLPEPQPTPRPGKTRRRRPLWRALAIAFLPWLALMIGDRVQERPKPSVQSIGPSKLLKTPRPAVLTPSEIRKLSFVGWVPTLTVTPAKPIWKGGPALAMGGLALLAAGGLWLAQRRRSWLPEPAPPPVQKGPPRVFLTPPDLTDPQLLEPRDQEALVWGIGHFVADEPTRRLDLRATVRETARAGGIPHLRFYKARHPREVWLWIDEAADDPAIARLADEIETALRSHRLPIERALFRGVPDWLVTPSGQAFAPNEVDERRDAAVVAVLTDGRILTRQHAADDRRVRIEALLRGLSHWPRLAFVDFAPEPGALAAVLGKHVISRIAPPELAAFLGSDESAKRKRSAGVTQDAVWAAACALAPASVDELRAFQLRKKLGLATSPWALRSLRTEAPGPLGRLQWQPQYRARRVNWLRQAEAQPDGKIARESLLGQALDFWEEIYDQELKQRQTGAGESAEPDTPAHQHLAMERALLGLWRNAPKAVRDLYRLHGGALRGVIERHLDTMAPLDWGGPELVHLPWAWADRSGAERIMLQEMKLAGGMSAATLRQPGRLWLGLGICLGLAMGALGAAAMSGWQNPEGPPVVHHGTGKPRELWEKITPVQDQEWSVELGLGQSSFSELTPAAAQVSVAWMKREPQCVRTFMDTGELWRCGSVEKSLRLLPFSEGGIILSTSPEDTEAVQLAVDLIDSGSTNQVILGPDWRNYRQAFRLTKGEILVLPSSNWSLLRKALHFTGRRAVRQVWPDLRLLDGDSSTLIRGLDTCRPGELLVEAGMTFVHICPGTFTMGSAAEDPLANPDERPAHQVTLSEFWIGRTEVTNGQYGSLGPHNLPAVRMNWYEANDFCARHGWRLPTEAEWEYAARAGTQTPWSFGADEKLLGQFAWFAGNSGSEPHSAGTRSPNPWGIADMHGNVWEWVTDWFGPYKPDPQRDPRGPDIGDRRSVRGGSFVGSPGFLRSAYRSGFQPAGLNSNFGFRCARSPGGTKGQSLVLED